VVLALCCAAFFEGAFVLKQRFLDGMDRVAGSLDHPNSLSMYLCLIAPPLVAAINSPLPRWMRWASGGALGVAGFAVLLTVSRAGVPTFALVVLGATLMCITWKLTLKKALTMGIVALVVVAVGVKFGRSLERRFSESTLQEEYLEKNVIDSRGYYLRLAALIVNDRLFGVGLNNWSFWVSKKYGAQLNTPYSDYDDIPADFNHDVDDLDMHFAAPAHNLCALTVGELGVPGLALFLLMWLRWFQMGLVFLWRRERTTMGLLGVGLFFGICGVFLQSITEWVFRQTPIYMTFHVLLGVLASLYAVRRRARKRAAAAQRTVYHEQEPAGATLAAKSF
jgi:O-antigen ligase